jgi:hypothetical protein
MRPFRSPYARGYPEIERNSQGTVPANQRSEHPNLNQFY